MFFYRFLLDPQYVKEHFIRFWLKFLSFRLFVFHVRQVKDLLLSVRRKRNIFHAPVEAVSKIPEEEHLFFNLYLKEHFVFYYASTSANSLFIFLRTRRFNCTSLSSRFNVFGMIRKKNQIAIIRFFNGIPSISKLNLVM